jgi:hypothetical protein
MGRSCRTHRGNEGIERKGKFDKLKSIPRSTPAIARLDKCSNPIQFPNHRLGPPKISPIKVEKPSDFPSPHSIFMICAPFASKNNPTSLTNIKDANPNELKSISKIRISLSIGLSWSFLLLFFIPPNKKQRELRKIIKYLINSFFFSLSFITTALNMNTSKFSTRRNSNKKQQSLAEGISAVKLCTPSPLKRRREDIGACEADDEVVAIHDGEDKADRVHNTGRCSCRLGGFKFAVDVKPNLFCFFSTDSYLSDIDREETLSDEELPPTKAYLEGRRKWKELTNGKGSDSPRHGAEPALAVYPPHEMMDMEAGGSGSQNQQHQQPPPPPPPQPPIMNQHALPNNAALNNNQDPGIFRKINQFSNSNLFLFSLSANPQPADPPAVAAAGVTGIVIAPATYPDVVILETLKEEIVTYLNVGIRARELRDGAEFMDIGKVIHRSGVVVVKTPSNITANWIRFMIAKFTATRQAIALRTLDEAEFDFTPAYTLWTPDANATFERAMLKANRLGIDITTWRFVRIINVRVVPGLNQGRKFSFIARGNIELFLDARTGERRFTYDAFPVKAMIKRSGAAIRPDAAGEPFLYSPLPFPMTYEKLLPFQTKLSQLQSSIRSRRPITSSTPGFKTNQLNKTPSTTLLHPSPRDGHAGSPRPLNCSTEFLLFVLAVNEFEPKLDLINNWGESPKLIKLWFPLFSYSESLVETSPLPEILALQLLFGFALPQSRPGFLTLQHVMLFNTYTVAMQEIMDSLADHKPNCIDASVVNKTKHNGNYCRSLSKKIPPASSWLTGNKLSIVGKKGVKGFYLKEYG